MPTEEQPPASSTPAYIIRELRSDDDCGQFQVEGTEFGPLKDFLHNHACNLHEIDVSKTYVAAIGRRVIAYVSLCCSQVNFDSPQTELPKIPYRAFPAVKIGQLAVDANFQKQKVGSTLISLAIALAKEHVQPRIGCRLLIVDSHKDAVPFYRGKGFIVVASGKEKKFPVMFLDIGKL